jgi:hypothetical protein
MDSALTELMVQVLAPFDEKRRDQMVVWMERELESQSIVDNVQDHVSGHEWTILQKSPVNAEAVVFCMLFHETMRAVCIYTCKTTPIAPDQASFEYFKEWSFGGGFNVHGPISPSALFEDLRLFAEGPPSEDDAPAAKTNGTSANA